MNNENPQAQASTSGFEIRNLAPLGMAVGAVAIGIGTFLPLANGENRLTEIAGGGIESDSLMSAAPLVGLLALASAAALWWVGKNGRLSVQAFITSAVGAFFLNAALLAATTDEKELFGINEGIVENMEPGVGAYFIAAGWGLMILAYLDPRGDQDASKEGSARQEGD